MDSSHLSEDVHRLVVQLADEASGQKSHPTDKVFGVLALNQVISGIFAETVRWSRTLVEGHWLTELFCRGECMRPVFSQFRHCEGTSRRLAVVETKDSAEPLAALDLSLRQADFVTWINQSVV